MSTADTIAYIKLPKMMVNIAVNYLQSALETVCRILNSAWVALWNQIITVMRETPANNGILPSISEIKNKKNNNFMKPACSRMHIPIEYNVHSDTPACKITISQDHSHQVKSQKNNPGTKSISAISSPYLDSRLCKSQSVCDINTPKTIGEMCATEEQKGITPEGLSWRRLHMSRAKLKATATTSELLSGFAMVAMVELQINEPTNVPDWLFVLFSVCTTVLVAVHIFALMISTYLLPHVDAISKLEVPELVGESPHERMRKFIELAWIFSTILGLFLFLVEIAILCWVKFWDYSFTAAWAATLIVVPVLILFVVFAIHFYHKLVVYKVESSVNNLQSLENMQKQLDNVLRSPV